MLGMMAVNISRNALRYHLANSHRSLFIPENVRNLSSIFDPPGNEGTIPEYERKENESPEIKRARLLYQSRKRGILENDLLLSTFAQKHLGSMDSSSLEAYDTLLNNSGNEWDIYYWVTGAKPVPGEFNTPVMNLLQQHARNKNKEQRCRQPDLEVAPL